VKEAKPIYCEGCGYAHGVKLCKRCTAEKEAREILAQLGAAGVIKRGELEAENQNLRVALEKIQSWCNAYPLKVFPEPDFKAVHKALKDAGLSLDAVSASNMRHVLDGIRGMVKDALKKQGGK